MGTHERSSSDEPNEDDGEVNERLDRLLRLITYLP